MNISIQELKVKDVNMRVDKDSYNFKIELQFENGLKYDFYTDDNNDIKAIEQLKKILDIYYIMEAINKKVSAIFINDKLCGFLDYEEESYICSSKYKKDFKWLHMMESMKY